MSIIPSSDHHNKTAPTETAVTDLPPAVTDPPPGGLYKSARDVRLAQQAARRATIAPPSISASTVSFNGAGKTPPTTIRESAPIKKAVKTDKEPYKKPSAARFRAMELITILNGCHHFRGFIYYRATFGPDHESIEISVHPRKARRRFVSPESCASSVHSCSTLAGPAACKEEDDVRRDDSP